MECINCPYFHIFDIPNSSDHGECCTVGDCWIHVEEPYKCVQPEKLRDTFYKKLGYSGKKL